MPFGKSQKAFGKKNNAFSNKERPNRMGGATTDPKNLGSQVESVKKPGFSIIVENGVRGGARAGQGRSKKTDGAAVIPSFSGFWGPTNSLHTIARTDRSAFPIRLRV